MALTRKFLSALGVEPEKVDEIINAHTETVDGLKDELARFRENAEKLAEVQAELEAIKAEAAKNGGKNPFEVKYNAIKEEFEAYKKEQAEKETRTAKSAAYRAALKKAGVSEKRIEAVLKVSDIEGVKLDKDGNIEGEDALVQSIKSEWADFITTEGVIGAQTANPPANSGSVLRSKDEIMKIEDTSERQQAWGEYIAAQQQRG